MAIFIKNDGYPKHGITQKAVFARHVPFANKNSGNCANEFVYLII